jgi:tetratricopeptide (TPR) repeat protein
MRIVFAVCTALLVTIPAPLPALAAGPAARDVAPPRSTQKSRAERLDKLFSDLKRERNDKAAERIANQIYFVWNDSGSASVDLMMLWAQKAITERKFDVALDFLDEVVTLQPDFVEGWNRRATVNFLMKNYAKSMADIDKTLKLEPRHFGAISGLAQIMSDTGRKEQALRAWQRVLDIYPMLRNAQQQVSTLSEDLAGESI